MTFSGTWAIKGITCTYFGSSSDTTIPEYYDGNGIWDLVYINPRSLSTNEMLEEV